MNRSADTRVLVKEAADIIRSGGVVVFPTETVYGLGANAFDERAVARVFEVKRRPYFDPLILHIAERECLRDLAVGVPAAAQRLIDALWPGPLTIVLPKKSVVPDIATAGLPGAALRMPSNDIALRLIRAAGVPVAAPSANLFGSVSPTTAEHAREQLGYAVDMIIDGGECSVGIESSIISFMEETPTLLRPGGTALEEIEAVIGKVAIPTFAEFVNQSPGRSGAHYATATPLVRLAGIDELNNISGANRIDGTDSLNAANSTNAICAAGIRIGLIALSPASVSDPAALPPAVAAVEYLSANGDLREAACRLFAAMRRLDVAGVDVIAALPVPTTGLGLAINDRLRRAAKIKLGGL